MSIDVFPIPAFKDNYIWCIHNHKHCVVVDPGDATPVLEYCQQQELHLVAIMITHHHWDHTGGLDDLLNTFPDLVIYGPHNPKIEQITHALAQGDEITLPQLDCQLCVLDVPGHTLDHIAFYGDLGLFCGDTLFSAGCGRLFEGTPEQMFDSLQKLTALPKETPVYCTHEYTLANIAFALNAEPNNQALIDYKTWAENQRQQALPTLPSRMEREKAVNPFIRCHHPEIIQQVSQHCGQQLATEQQVFAALRSWKDHF